MTQITYRSPGTSPTASTELRKYSLPFESGPQPSSSHAISTSAPQAPEKIVMSESWNGIGTLPQVWTRIAPLYGASNEYHTLLWAAPGFEDH